MTSCPSFYCLHALETSLKHASPPSFSQSLLWERMIFQSRAFWKFAGPLVRARFPHTEGVSDEGFYRGLNRVAPSLIRVDADEVTYPLHIILR